jgi:hypothetical protein
MNINDKLVLNNEDEILERQYQLRKIAISYWKFFTFSACYCISYPIIFKAYGNIKPVHNVIGGLAVSYFLSQLIVKQIIKLFNSRDYLRYRTFCKKYKLIDNRLI